MMQGAQPQALWQPGEVGWVGGGTEVHEGGDACMPMLVHVAVWQKPVQYCEASILQ